MKLRVTRNERGERGERQRYMSRQNQCGMCVCLCTFFPSFYYLFLSHFFLLVLSTGRQLRRSIFGFLPFTVADAIISKRIEWRKRKILIWLHINKAIPRYHWLIKRTWIYMYLCMRVYSLGKHGRHLQSPLFVAIVFNFN